MTPEEVEEIGLTINPIRIADGKVSSIAPDEESENDAPPVYTLENNQILFSEDGLDAVIEKLEDGNIVMSVFLPGENDMMNCVSFFMIHPEA